jgi:thiol:disulfide interchange protein DsbD
MYSQFTPDGGPLALEVIFKIRKIILVVGKAKKAKQQPLTMIFFEVDETYFRISPNSAGFVLPMLKHQKLKPN